MSAKVEVIFEGRWGRDAVRAVHRENVWACPAEMETEVEARWAEASLTKGRSLFDGPMARVDRIVADSSRLELILSRTSYKPFFAIHFSELKERFVDRNELPNPLGVSVALESADDQLLFGRRGGKVAYYPNRIHPFAGTMEPGDATPFETAVRELMEEARLEAQDVEEMEVVGMVRDAGLWQPEVIVRARTRKTADEIRRGLDAAEHDELIVAPFQSGNVDAVEMLMEDVAVTPVCLGALMLWSTATGR